MNRRVTSVLLPLCFCGSCAALTAPVFLLLEPTTHTAVDSIEAPFRILAMYGNGPRILELADPHNIPILPDGASYLVPVEKKKVIDQYLYDDYQRRAPGAEGGWVLSIDPTAPDRQRIELYVLNDGFFGGAYEATPTTVRPLYRKITGPGFAIGVASTAFTINAVLWGVGRTKMASLRRRRAARAI